MLTDTVKVQDIVTAFYMAKPDKPAVRLGQLQKPNDPREMMDTSEN